MYAEANTVDHSSILGILIYLNTVTDGWFSIMVMLSLYAISIIAYYKSTGEMAASFSVSGFFVFVVALFFWIAGFLPVYAFIISIALALIGLLALMFS